MGAFKKIKKLLHRAKTLAGWCVKALPAALLYFTGKVQKNKIAFMTFNFRYACNPKYICQEILRQNLPVELVWVVPKAQLKDPQIRASFPKNAKLVGFGSLAFIKEIMTAKVWVDNAFNFTWNPVPKKKDQFYIQTWHGSLGLKRIGNESVKDRRWAFSARLNARYVNLCVSNSTFETGVFRETHWPNNPVLELGHPRNDILFADEAQKAEIKQKVCDHFGIPENAKIALYAPTFRSSDTLDAFNLDHSRFLDTLQKRFGGDWILLNRYHFKTASAGLDTAPEMDARILPASDYPDIQELMVAADVGVTDYSSWICDFVLTGRPGFLYAPDLQSYDQTRGFYYPLTETPFPIAQTNDELKEKILSFDQDAYAVKKQQFLEKRGSKEQGTAAKEIVEIIKKQCGIA